MESAGPQEAHEFMDITHAMSYLGYLGFIYLGQYGGGWTCFMDDVEIKALMHVKPSLYFKMAKLILRSLYFYCFSHFVLLFLF